MKALWESWEIEGNCQLNANTVTSHGTSWNLFSLVYDDESHLLVGPCSAAKCINWEHWFSNVLQKQI